MASRTARLSARQLALTAAFAAVLAAMLTLLGGTIAHASAIESEIIEQANYGGPTAQMFYIIGGILFVGVAIIAVIVWLRKRQR